MSMDRLRLRRVGGDWMLIAAATLVFGLIAVAPSPAGATSTGAAAVSPPIALSPGPAPMPQPPGSPAGSPPSGAKWTVEKTVDPLGAAPTELAADSCVGSAFCMAVGYAYTPTSPNTPIELAAEEWNGTKWTVESIPNPADATTYGIYLEGVSCATTKSCVAVGDYENTSDVFVTLAEVWNGKSWSIHPPTNPGPSYNYLNSVSCTSASACVAVGDYESASLVSGTLAEAWNGTTWSVQTTADVSGSNDYLDGVSCTAAKACTAVGDSSNFSAGQLNLAEAWDGTTWTIQSTPSSDPADDLNYLDGVSCTSASACTAVGYYDDAVSFTDVPVAMGWNGISWAAQSPVSPDGGSAELSGVSCTSDKGCLAVGYYFGDDTDLALSETLSGTTWTVQGTPYPANATASELKGVSCTSATACTAAGYYGSSSGINLSLAEGWNGTVSTIELTPNATGTTPASSALYSVSCSSATACTAVGSYFDTSGVELTLAEAWSGTSWTIQKTPNPVRATAPGSVLDGVSCTSASACTAVGYYYTSSNSTVMLAERWDGTNWTIQTTPNPVGGSDTVFSGVSCSSATACTAVGYNFNSTLAEAWNGTAWKVETTPNVGGTDDSYLLGVSCTSAKVCNAVGYYYSSTPAELTLAEVWNGTTWKIQTTPSPGGIKKLDESDLAGVSCSSATACTAAGYYWKNSVEAYVIVAEAWNGAAWTVQKTPDPVDHSETEGAAPPLDGVSCSSAAACTIAGSYENSEGEQLSLAEAWSGAAWTVQKTPSTSTGTFYGVSCTSATACTAVGIAEDNDTEVTLAERYG